MLCISVWVLSAALFPWQCPCSGVLGSTQCGPQLARRSTDWGGGWCWCVRVSSGHFSPVHSQSEPLTLARFTLSRASLQSSVGEAGIFHLCDAQETSHRVQSSVLLPGSISVHQPSSRGAVGLRKPKALPVNRAGSLLLAKSWHREPILTMGG